MKSGLKSLVLFLAISGVFFLGKTVYMSPKFDSGEAVPNFSVKLQNGQDFSLKDLQGNMVLLSFWGSWCQPCRAKTPELISIYDKYHDREYKDFENFEVVSVSIEKDEQRWARAIKSWDLHWKYHILDKTSNYKFFDGAIASEFGVKSVPASYLLNASGQIIGVNLSGKELDIILQKEIKE